MKRKRLILIILLCLSNYAQAEDNELRIKELVQALQNNEESVRNEAAKSLTEIGLPAVKALILALKSPEAKIRAGAIFTLGNIGPIAKEAVPELIIALKDVHWTIRKSVAFALGKIGLEAQAATEALTIALKDSNLSVRRNAAKALWEIGQVTDEAIWVLAQALNDPEKKIRDLSSKILLEIGNPAIPSLIRALNFNGEGKISAIEILFQMEEPALTALIWALNEENNNPNIPEALIYFLKEGNKDISQSAAFAMGKLGERAMPFLMEVLVGKKTNYGRNPISSHIAVIGTSKIPTYKNEWVIDYTTSALATIGASSIPILIEGLSDFNNWVQFRASETLIKIGAPAVPSLIETLKNGNLSARKRSAYALGIIQVEDAKLVLSALNLALGDFDSDVRVMAAMSLKKIKGTD